MILALVVGLFFSLLPVSCLVLLARSMGKWRAVPPVAVRIAYAAAGVAGLVSLIAFVRLVAEARVVDPVDPSGKARMLAEGISEAINCFAFTSLVLIVTAVALLIWSWIVRPRRP